MKTTQNGINKQECKTSLYTRKNLTEFKNKNLVLLLKEKSQPITKKKKNKSKSVHVRISQTAAGQ